MLHERVLKLIREEIKAQQDHILAGGAVTFTDYRYVVGVLHGLNMAVDIILEEQPKEDEEDHV